MKLLIFAHTPPPVHGQSVMVKMLLDGLQQDPGFDLIHVNARLSRDGADIGRWRPGKLASLIGACLRAWSARLRHGPAIFYYVPAPGKRGALYRDLVVMLLCRPLFPRLVLHWHAVGLGAWLHTQATAPERWLARHLLGKADLSIVLSPTLSADAEYLTPLRTAIVRNGIPAGAELQPGTRGRTTSRCEVLFIGLCSREKGLFDLLDAFRVLVSRAPGSFHLTIAGGFGSAADERDVRARLAALPRDTADFVGFADESRKRNLFANADVFCFPTQYPHEGQPLVLIEALAHDVRIVTTRWRAIPEMLPSSQVWFVEPGQPENLSAALLDAAAAPRPQGALRQHYLAHFTRERHVAALAAALRKLPA